MPQPESQVHSPRCQTCSHVLPSYTAPTGLRCGVQYFQATPLLRKLRPMSHYPVVKAENACEAWTDAPNDIATPHQ
jgi:hypothetical protein